MVRRLFMLALVAGIVSLGAVAPVRSQEKAAPVKRDPRLIAKWELSNGAFFRFWDDGEAEKGYGPILKHGSWRTEKTSTGKDQLICVWRDDAVFPNSEGVYTLSSDGTILTLDIVEGRDLKKETPQRVKLEKVVRK
ncbi:MAG TPA: hypothetical protein VGE59_04190 [Patescibacteria group bacterium]